MMTRNEFTELLDIYGADLSRWPQDKLKSALDLTEKDSVARDAFDRTLALEDMLRGDEIPDASLPALENRIMAAINDLPVQAPAVSAVRTGFFGWRTTYMVAPPMGLLAIAVFGFMLGMQPSSQRESLVHPVYYQADQILADDDASFYQGGIF
jgi:hypothetical protein